MGRGQTSNGRVTLDALFEHRPEGRGSLRVHNPAKIRKARLDRIRGIREGFRPRESTLMRDLLDRESTKRGYKAKKLAPGISMFLTTWKTKPDLVEIVILKEHCSLQEEFFDALESCEGTMLEAHTEQFRIIGTIGEGTDPEVPPENNKLRGSGVSLGKHRPAIQQFSLSGELKTALVFQPQFPEELAKRIEDEESDGINYSRRAYILRGPAVNLLLQTRPDLEDKMIAHLEAHGASQAGFTFKNKRLDEALEGNPEAVDAIRKLTERLSETGVIS